MVSVPVRPKGVPSLPVSRSARGRDVIVRPSPTTSADDALTRLVALLSQGLERLMARSADKLGSEQSNHIDAEAVDSSAHLSVTTRDPEGCKEEQQ